MRLRTLLAAAAVTALAVPADALADKTFKGKTAQNRSVAVTTLDDNLLRSIRINWITRRCADSDARMQDFTTFRAPFDSATADGFADAGAYTVRQSGGIRIRIRITVDGRRELDPANPAAERWVGSVKARVKIRRRGVVIDRCRLRPQAWSATLVP